MRNAIWMTALALCLGVTAANAFDLDKASNIARTGVQALGNLTGRAMCDGNRVCGSVVGNATGKVFDAGQSFTRRASPKLQQFGASLRRR